MENEISSVKRNARIAGLLFLIFIVTGMYNMLYVSSKINLKGDVATAVQSMLSHELLFRTGIIVDLITGTIWILMVMVFYRLFKPVNDNHSKLLVAFVLVQIPVFFIMEAFNLTALMAFKGEVFNSFPINERQDVGMAFLKINEYVSLTLITFWGLWLLPLSVLVYRSQFMPRFLGVWLFINGIAYIVLSFVGLLLPKQYDSFYKFLFPVFFGELVFALWLLIKGAKNKISVHSRI